VEPDLSVVVASSSGETVLRHCLESLEPQAAEDEVIVATDVEASGIARLEARYPRFRFLRAPRGTSVFRLRALGIDQARGRLVVLTEDHCMAAPGWLQALRASHGAGRLIVGGPVDNGRQAGAYDWALYLCEYGAQMPPLRDGPARSLSGVNAAYDRALLAGCRGVWRDGFYEREVHEALRASGHRLHRSGTACVTSYLSLPLREAAAHRFRGGQRFGQYRRGRLPAVVRALQPVVALALPALLTGRALRSVALRRPRQLGAAARALGYMVALNAAWAAGEALGSLRPVAGPQAEALAPRGITSEREQ
jgi:glycosyltransferase involved in cell wall biosynthesis